MGKRARPVTKEGKNGAGPRKPGKKQVSIVAAVVLIAAMLVYFAVCLGANGASGKAAVSSSAAEGQDAGSAAAGTPSGTEEPSPEESSGSGNASAPSSATGESSGTESDDGYVLPPDSDSQQTVSQGTSSAAVPQEPERQAAPGVKTASSEGDGAQADDYSGPEISREEYDSLRNGMTYDEVKAAVGGPGTLTTDSNANTKIYKWSGIGSSDSYAQLTFKSGKLAFKIQFGL